jgi:ribosome maturation factor RimP
LSPLFLQILFMIKQEQVIKLVEERFEGTDKFLVEVLIQPVNNITVYFDGDKSVSIADCQSLSRFIEERLDRDYSDYQLTVSSAGMDRPIKLLRQYRKRIGKELEVVSLEGEKMTGILVNAGEEAIELEHPVKNLKKDIKKPNSIIALSKIKSAKIIITFGK